MARMLEDVIKGAANEAGNPRGVDEIAAVITDVNRDLKHEAERTGVKNIPAMPDPKDTAAKIGKFMQWVEKQATSEEGQREIGRAMESLRYEVIRDAYNTEEQVKRAMGGVDPVKDPAKAAKAIGGLVGEISDRDYKHAADMLGHEFNITTSAGEIKTFVHDSAATAEKILGHPVQYEKKAEHAAVKLEHEVEREGARELRKYRK